MKNTYNLKRVKKAAIQLSQLTEKERNMFLEYLIDALLYNKNDIVKANKLDIKNARNNNMLDAFIQRLTLNKKGIEKLIEKLNSLKDLTSTIGSTLSSKKLRNGIVLRKIVVPLGVILIMYESRPEVTIEAAALCVKSGNAVLLKGGSEAFFTNRILYTCIQKALRNAYLAQETIQLVEDRKEIGKLLKQSRYIDVVIARGGYDMVKNVMNQTNIAVLAHASGGARIYIDKSADLKIINKIIINAKTSKSSACNSLDTVLVHKDIALTLVPSLVKKLQAVGVKVLGDTVVNKLANTRKALQSDWQTEFLGLTMGIKVVSDAEEAIDFINTYTKRHSEGIIAEDNKVISAFVNSIDAAGIFINCSTRFHDGYEFGMGSEIGIATGKLHARGPVGLKELTTYRWEVYGNGHIRE